MKKRILKFIMFFLLFLVIEKASFALNEGIVIDENTFSFANMKQNIFSDFNSNSYTQNNNDKENGIKQEIINLTKKTTYLLLGDANKGNESSEKYFKRYRDYLNLRYNPEIPKDENNSLGVDTNSQEYKDDILSGLSVPGIFSKLNELGVDYNIYGNIVVSKINDDLYISTISLPDVIMKEPDNINPMKYNQIQTDLNITYYFKKLDNEFKLLYLYGETNEEIIEYVEGNAEDKDKLLNDEIYDSNLRDLYDFSKLNEITEKITNKIYDKNKSNIVFLNSMYTTGIVTSANGFFITENLIVTTYNYIEKSLEKSQNIIISNGDGISYELEGIVMMNKENDVAILKVKNKNNSYVEFGEEPKIEIEDAVIALNSKTGVGLTVSKGIIIGLENDIQTSIPIIEEMQGSLIFDKNGQIIGMINSKMINTSISFATNVEVFQKYYDEFLNIKANDIKTVSFEEMKENYYTKYSEEKNVNTISQDKWTEYRNVENANENIILDLVKASYIDGIISLRYKNNISKYVDTMQFAKTYIEQLKNKGYEEKIISDSKYIYENGEYQIIIMEEFNYLIIVMVEL